jgi:protease-4
MLAGLAGETLYFKNLFDMLGIHADMIHIGDYKSAAEPLTRTEPSEQELQQFNQLFDGLYDHMLQSIAESRNITIQQVRRIIDQGPFTASQAKEQGLIDEIMYREEFLKQITEQEEAKISLKLDYGLPPKPYVNTEDPFAMLSVLQNLFSTPPEPAGDAIAVIYINGQITSGDSMETFDGSVIGCRTIRMALAKARADKNIKGIVIRIDSPGGSATASDIIYNAILQTAKEKPVVVSMGSLAASGGYYAACGAQTILAQSSTITGSIGVVGGKIVLGGLLKKLGINSHTFYRGRNASLFSSMKPFSPAEHINLMQNMQHIYEIFKNCVVQSRGEKLTEPIEYLAQGKIYTGLQAKHVGLIDEIGTFKQAIQMVAEQAGTKNSDRSTRRHIRYV